ncbi:MAG: S-layer homology domain-containing protein [Candidatus Obscuribacterales bacterium]|nr:S-layer homology domain-containing protein [Candidatus Obscuribacterales bacterium]
MRLTLKIAFTLTLSSFLFCEPAHAADFSKVLESFSGAINGWQEFDTQKVQLASAIDSAQAVGQLSKAQADDFRQQLDALNQQEAQAKSSGRLMNFVQSITFNKQFSALVAQVETAVDQGKLTAPDVVQSQSALRTRIDADLQSGRLSADDATAIKAELAHVSSIESAFRAESNGVLSPRQTELLLVEVNKVKAKLDQEEELSDSGARTLEFRRLTIEKKINDGLAQSRLAPTDANAFRDRLTQLAARQKSFQSANRTLTGGQVLQLAGELDTIGASIDQKLSLSTATVPAPTVGAGVDDFQDQFQRMDHRISRLASSGRIPANDASDLRHDLGRTIDLYQAYKTANPILTPIQTAKLDSELDRVSSRLEQLRQSSVATVPQLPGSQGSNLPGSNTGSNPANPYGGVNPVNPYGGDQGGQGRHDWHGHGDRGHGRDNNGAGSNNDPNSSIPVQVNTNSQLSFPVIGNKVFTDIEGYWAQPYISQLANRGVIGGFPNGTFRPDAKITRAQFAAIAAQALKLPTGSATNNFTDVPANYWAAPVIGAASNAGLIGGFPDGSFKPEDNLTRAQALVILSKALKSTSSNPAALNAYSDSQAVPSWASPSVIQAANAHIIVGFPDANQIRPNSLTVRGEVAGLMYQTLSALGADLPRINIGVAETSK